MAHVDLPDRRIGEKRSDEMGERGEGDGSIDNEDFAERIWIVCRIHAREGNEDTREPLRAPHVPRTKASAVDDHDLAAWVSATRGPRHPPKTLASHAV